MSACLSSMQVSLFDFYYDQVDSLEASYSVTCAHHTDVSKYSANDFLAVYA
jgi:hypothetical protein